MNIEEDLNLQKEISALKGEMEILEAELDRKNRKLEIETALERVRVRAIDMRGSSELAETSSVMFHQFEELGIETIRTGVGIFDDENNAMEIWLTLKSGDKEAVRILDYFNINIHPVFANLLPAREQNQPYALTILSGEEVRMFYQNMATYHLHLDQAEQNQQEYFYSFFFPEGSINIVTKKALTEEERGIMVRMAGVFGLIYTRFQDLQKAESYSKEVLRQSSLDRVRAEIASMRTTWDLEKITPLIWKELGVLGVPFFRCGVFIILENRRLCRVYLTTPTGDSLAVMELPFESSNLIEKNVIFWRKKEIYTEEWDGNQFIDWMQRLIQQGYLKDQEKFQGNQNPPEYLALHFIPFEQGMLYVGSNSVLYEESLDIIQDLANAFSVAYARFEDFNHLEETLQNLKDAQKQLIHAEKMASLGELTAGIAHEIKNPLNFVNNFSELNAELIDELVEELEIGEFEQARATAINIRGNEEKISHHGKRADGIVQSMLQHSRGGSQEKVPTDINALGDEYLRLAYHGMRAKDKSFNVEFELDLDPDLPDIEVIPQDIGRVLLNLINNAFQACGMPQPRVFTSAEASDFAKDSSDKSAKAGTRGLVVVSTKKNQDVIQITICDNGPGIPAEIKDKIFQPFFTTKPTGQGTGLGLSLSYDIVKAHGGELSVETKEGEGSTFMITLPIVGKG